MRRCGQEFDVAVHGKFGPAIGLWLDFSDFGEKVQ